MKTISRQKYILNMPTVERFLKNHPTKHITELAGIIAVATECPILIVCQYIGELTSFTPELLNKMEVLKLFYQIDAIVD